jgi:hypothetical protein
MAMKTYSININQTNIEPGLEWFALKKRSQRARNTRLKRIKQRDATDQEASDGVK